MRVVREMLRVAPRVLLAESLPIARTDAQRAHLTMYDLREDVFAITAASRDDLRYRSLPDFAVLVERAGGIVETMETREIDLPHFLARFPRALIEAIPPGTDRAGLLRRWDEAEALLQQYGEDHPPVGFVTARRPSAPI